MQPVSSLRLAAVNRHRQRLFGDSSLKVYTTTPEAGETLAATFAKDWFAQRVWRTTDQGVKESGRWQFQIPAKEDWGKSQAFMLAIVALTVYDRRWKVTKIEKPIGTSLMWKVKAEIQ